MSTPEISQNKEQVFHGYTDAVVFGVFDFAHIGHYQHISKIISQFPDLSRIYFWMASDERVSKLKGNLRPIQSFEMRSAALDSIMQQINPDIVTGSIESVNELTQIKEMADLFGAPTTAIIASPESNGRDYIETIKEIRVQNQIAGGIFLQEGGASAGVHTTDIVPSYPLPDFIYRGLPQEMVAVVENPDRAIISVVDGVKPVNSNPSLYLDQLNSDETLNSQPLKLILSPSISSDDLGKIIKLAKAINRPINISILRTNAAVYDIHTQALVDNLNKYSNISARIMGSGAMRKENEDVLIFGRDAKAIIKDHVSGVMLPLLQACPEGTELYGKFLNQLKRGLKNVLEEVPDSHESIVGKIGGIYLNLKTNRYWIIIANEAAIDVDLKSLGLNLEEFEGIESFGMGTDGGSRIHDVFHFTYITDDQNLRRIDVTNEGLREF